MTLPQYYPDNVTLLTSDTLLVRGNQVSDIQGATAVGIRVSNATNLRAKYNQSVRIRSTLDDAKAYEVNNVDDAVLVYNTASRTNLGFDFNSVTALSVYNATANLCDIGFASDTPATFVNIAILADSGYDLYKKAIGFDVSGGVSTVDYLMHFGLASVAGTSGANLTQGGYVYEKKLLYLDEPHDELTPDYISYVVSAGTDNPLRSSYVDISGINSLVTIEATADINYWYNLIDNTFWDTGNINAVESSFIRAFQSRVLANSEVSTNQIDKDIKIKFASSLAAFSSLYPMNSRYSSTTKFKRCVMDMWFSGQNPAVIQAYQNAIGGYNRFPSFMRPLSDYEDGWIIDVSYVNYDNWLNSMEDLKYGIGIDVLGTSTMNQATSGECYHNTQNTVSDVAPVRWFLHNEVEPSGYFMFTDLYNGFENCVLENFKYNDDFGIDVLSVSASAVCVTPLLSTLTLFASGAPSGYIELSWLDRTYNESIDRHIYCRQGDIVNSMSSWVELPNVICVPIYADKSYLQFKLTVDNVEYEEDYEFVGLCLRQYRTDLDWTRDEPVPPTPPSPTPVPPGLWLCGYTIVMPHSVYHWDGASMATEYHDVDKYHFCIHVNSATDIWAGNYNAVTFVNTIDRLTPAGWTVQTIPDDTNTPALLFGTGSDDMWMVDDGPWMYHWNGSAWSADVTGPDIDDVTGIWTVVGNNKYVLAIGNYDDGGGLKGYRWSSLNEALLAEDFSTVDYNFYGIWGTDFASFWMVGENVNTSVGSVHYFDGLNDTLVIDGSALGGFGKLESVHGTDANHVWAVGTDVILFWNGVTWAKQALPADITHLDKVWAKSPTEVYATGHGLHPTIPLTFHRYLLGFDGLSWIVLHEDIAAMGSNILYMGISGIQGA